MFLREVKAKGSAANAVRNLPARPAGKLAYDLSSLAEASLDHAPKRWSGDRCRNSLAKVMAALQVTPRMLTWSLLMQYYRS